VVLRSAAIVETGIFRRNEQVRAAWRSPLRQPALVVFGDSDVALLPNLLYRIGDILPRAAIHVLPRCSHWMQQDAPDDVNTLLLGFLAGKSMADTASA
jgi:epoxide hydrolase 4